LLIVGAGYDLRARLKLVEGLIFEREKLTTLYLPISAITGLTGKEAAEFVDL
jgi:hypothetical protein